MAARAGTDPDRPADLLRAALAIDAARPAVTFYDDATGERVELSVATLDNWVAKTANMLQDGFAVEPGARVALHLPLHWLGPVWLLACWAAGAVAVPAGDPADSDVVVTGPDRLAASAASGAQVVAVSLRPLGAPFAAPLPAGVLDYAREVPSYGDRFAPLAPVTVEAPALELDRRRWNQRDLATVDPLGLSASDRVLVTVPYDTWTGLHAGLLAPLAAGAGIVLARHLDADRLVARVSQERITATVEPMVDGVRALL